MQVITHATNGVKHSPLSFRLASHETYLSARAVDPDYALFQGLRSIDEDELRETVGPHPAGILIPYAGEPLYVRIRLDREQGGQRFWCPPGVAPRPYVIAREGAQRVVIVEGPVKALALAQHMTAETIVGLGGVEAGAHDVEAWREREAHAPHPELAAACRGREVIIYFDAGLAKNPNVMRGAMRTFLVLRSCATAVRVISPPLHEGQDQGPDDYLARCGGDIAPTLDLLTRAKAADPVLRLTSEALPDVASDPLAGAYLALARESVSHADIPDAWEALVKERAGKSWKKLAAGPERNYHAALNRARDVAPVEVTDTRDEIDVSPGIGCAAYAPRIAESVADGGNIYLYGTALSRVVGRKLETMRDADVLVAIERTARLVVKNGKQVCPVRARAEHVRLLESVATTSRIPRLDSVRRHPYVDTRGNVNTTGIHDRVLCLPDIEVDVPNLITRDDAVEGARVLSELLRHFSFVDPRQGASAVISAVLDVVARPAIAGLVPGLWISAPDEGQGKTSLCRLPAHIVLGRPPEMLTPTDPKAIISVLRHAPECVEVDNITAATYGPGPLVSAMTSDIFSGRWLGRSEMLSCPVRCVFAFSGINIRPTPDLARRVRIVKMIKPLVAPKFPREIGAEVADNRSKYLRAALVIVAGYIQAGRPPQNLPAVPSFEAWTGLTRSACVWAGLADPWPARVEDESGVDDVLGDLLDWLIEPRSADTIRDLGERDTNGAAGIIERLVCDGRRARELSAESVGRALTKYRDRLHPSGRRLVQSGTHPRLWSVRVEEAR